MHKIRSEITGSVWKVEVTVGQSVSEGDTLVIVESMKMEIPISAPASGVVTEILIVEGEPVADDQVVMHLDLAAHVRR
jgi:biotin carboxyl carrier protein